MNGFHALSVEHIRADTPMGGNLLDSPQGATFRVWAPAARDVRLLWRYVRDDGGEWRSTRTASLQPTGNGFWAGFVPGLRDGERYLYHVVGPAGGTEGLKRDPYARSLTLDPPIAIVSLSFSAFHAHRIFRRRA
jgi:1,4-alpha-glucan branching enzyme